MILAVERAAAVSRVTTEMIGPYCWLRGVYFHFNRGSKVNCLLISGLHLTIEKTAVPMPWHTDTA